MEVVIQHEKNPLRLVQADQLEPIDAPIVSSYNERIRPLLDAVDKLRHLMITKEGIQLPTIVVVGDQSSGKSSVLESLAGIDLPRGQGICTRVPLIMRLQHYPIPEPQLFLEYSGKVIETDVAHVSEAINLATDEIAGNGKGISDIPLTLELRKNGVPDLTMVDLPGITRVPVRGQPADIYDQVKGIIMKYITPQESIILNVLSATVDFTTCESIRMSQTVDKTGERTLAVVTKVDKAPEGLLEKVDADDVKIGLGYVCVRNRIGDESYEEARAEEARLFETHPQLSKIDKSIVGIPVLAQKLVQIQANIISRNLPVIVKQINDKLTANLAELNRLPKNLSSVSEAMIAIMQIIGSAEESLRKILLRGEFDEYPNDKHMHSTARMVEMLNQYSDELHGCGKSDPKRIFFMEEIEHLEEAKGITLPNFLPRSAFVAILQEKVKDISRIPIEFTGKIWSYIEEMLISVLKHHSENYHQLQLSITRACRNLISKLKDRSVNWVMEIVEMEKLTDYTCNPGYLSEWNKLMTGRDEFMRKIISNNYSSVSLEGFGVIEVGGLYTHAHVLNQAFDLKMRITAYWKIVLMRLVDYMALHLKQSVFHLVDKELETAIVDELMGPRGGGIETMLQESSSVAGKRVKLTNSIHLLKESKEVVARIMDKIATYGENVMLLN